MRLEGEENGERRCSRIWHGRCWGCLNMQAFLLFFVSSHIGYTPTGELNLLQIIRARLFPAPVRPKPKEASRISVLPISSLRKTITKLLVTSSQQQGGKGDRSQASASVKDMPAGCRRRASTDVLDNGPGLVVNEFDMND